MSIVRSSIARHLICLIALQFIAIGFAEAQPFVDACFTGPTVGTSFAANANISNNNADLIRWTGASWTGAWPGANIVIAPPGAVVGTRAIWSGDGSVWTTGGEGFGLRLTTPIVTGTTYTFAFYRISHGTGQNGSFRPVMYTNTSGTFGTSYGNIPTVGTAWSNSNISFTAIAASSGHTFVYFHNSVGSGMFMGCTTVILPMAFSQLQAMQVADEVQLQWLVQDERDYLWHVVERSEDGQSFAEVGRLPSVQAGEEGHLYNHADGVSELPNYQVVYYRIRSIDMEGKEAMSPVVMTRLGGDLDFETRVFPNPVTRSEVATVEFYAAANGVAHFEITDMQGRQIRQGQWPVTAARNLQQIDCKDLPRGTYFLHIGTGTHQSKVKLLLQ